MTTCCSSRPARSPTARSATRAEGPWLGLALLARPFVVLVLNWMTSTRSAARRSASRSLLMLAFASPSPSCSGRSRGRPRPIAATGMTARSLAWRDPSLGTTLPFALPIGLSAFLLFSVEPLVGRLVLPVFGGTPAVWATVLFFFQAVLLAGYLYGHLSVTRLGAGARSSTSSSRGSPSRRCCSPRPMSRTSASRSSTPVVDLLRILVLIVGLPAFVLTTTTPLISGWFAAARSDEGGDPVLAVRPEQRRLAPRPAGLSDRSSSRGSGWRRSAGCGRSATRRWSSMLAVAATRVLPALRARTARALPLRRASPRPGRRPPPSTRPGRRGRGVASAIDWPRRLRWLLLAAIPSGLLSAVTNFIATDLVSAPLLWVAPLAIYLAVVHRRVLPARRMGGPAQRPGGAGDDHAAVGPVRLGRRLAAARGPRDGARRPSGSSPSRSTAGSPRTGRLRPT